jgi:hypothetical protein
MVCLLLLELCSDLLTFVQRLDRGRHLPVCRSPPEAAKDLRALFTKGTPKGLHKVIAPIVSEVQLSLVFFLGVL